MYMYIFICNSICFKQAPYNMEPTRTNKEPSFPRIALLMFVECRIFPYFSYVCAVNIMVSHSVEEIHLVTGESP